MAGSSNAQFATKAALVVFVSLLLAASTAPAATRSMTGQLQVDNPSNGGASESGPGVFGRKVGGAGPVTYPPTNGAKNIQVAGATTSTFVGRQITLAAGQLNYSGLASRNFPPFTNVGQTTKSFMSVQEAAVLGENLGALAACPGGPGCKATGTAISWCAPFGENPTNPAPGTALSPVGDWNCPSWGAGFGGGNNGLRIAINNASGRPNFGGTLSVLRNFSQNVWRVPGAPSTPNASDAEATRSWMDINALRWSPGRPNFDFATLPGNNGPRILARLSPSGAVTETFGCVNGSGTVGVGGSFMRGVPYVGAGNNCGTNTVANAPGIAWGFALTTGTVSGSDPYPFGLVVTTVGGTPFNPNFGTQPASAGFFFSRMGTDTVTTMNDQRNIVMLGGGVAADPDSGNSFFRIMDFRMTLNVPEPAAALGLIAGAGALVALARRRRA